MILFCLFLLIVCWWHIKKFKEFFLHINEYSILMVFEGERERERELTKINCPTMRLLLVWMVERKKLTESANKKSLISATGIYLFTILSFSLHSLRVLYDFAGISHFIYCCAGQPRF